MTQCPACGYREDQQQVKRITNEMAAYLNSQGQKAIFNRLDTKFTDGNGVEWIRADKLAQAVKTQATSEAAPVTEVVKPTSSPIVVAIQPQGNLI